jgi:2-methylisocitrate lyase-like PEP mutase family enzyme
MKNDKLSAGARLRRLMELDQVVVAPGAPDALTAILIKEQGFEAVYCTGGGVSRSRGLADLGYTTLTETVERVANITETCDLPMIVDADAGFGTALSVQRAVRLLERAGAAGLHIEDEEVPPRNPSPAKNFVSFQEMTGRVRAALDARSDPSFLVIGRTDVLLHHGLDAAIDRANGYLDAGADMAYVEFLQKREDVEAIAKRVRGLKIINQIKGETAILTQTELAQMGFKIMIHPADAQLAAIHAMRQVLKHLKRTGSSVGYNHMVSFAERDRIVDTEEHRRRLAQYLPAQC